VPREKWYVVLGVLAQSKERTVKPYRFAREGVSAFILLTAGICIAVGTYYHRSRYPAKPVGMAWIPMRNDHASMA
jgi:hypothetical protein